MRSFIDESPAPASPVQPSVTPPKPRAASSQYVAAGAGLLVIVALVAGAWWIGNGGIKWLTTTKASAATYVYEKDSHKIPAGVRTGLDKLNKDGLVATAIDQDVKNGSGETPEQYREAIPAAVKAGLPSLVYHAGDKVLTIVKDPQTEKDVLDNKP